MNLRLTPVWIALALATTAAHATDDIYFGAGVGAAHFNGLNNAAVETGTEDAAATNLFMGYNFNETFGAELGYQYAGRGNTNSGINNNAYENQGATLSGIARLPAAFAVERRLVDQHEAALAGLQRGNLGIVANQRGDDAQLQFVGRRDDADAKVGQCQ